MHFWNKCRPNILKGSFSAIKRRISVRVFRKSERCICLGSSTSENSGFSPTRGVQFVFVFFFTWNSLWKCSYIGTFKVIFWTVKPFFFIEHFVISANYLKNRWFLLIVLLLVWIEKIAFCFHDLVFMECHSSWLSLTHFLYYKWGGCSFSAWSVSSCRLFAKSNGKETL